ncbi:ABC transporter permease [Halomicrococcus sp. NG-SE-24]|uniref:ABC transporter permease n=1 Tax=unclassified Halomicrococcus TaxID=2614448 RepID=UPI003D96F9CD
MSTVDAIRRSVDIDEFLLRMLENMIWPILLLMSLAIWLVVPRTFTNLRSFEFILHGSVGLGFVALAEAVCLISGHFDLSVGSIAGFSAMLAGLIVSANKWALVSDPFVGVLVILSIGLAVGLVNGVMVGKVGINPFLQTLAFLIILQGAKLSLSTITVTGLPEGYVEIGNSAEISVGLLVLTFVLVGLVMKYTSFGQAIYAVGSDKEAARAVGINTERMIIAVYGISGVLSAAGGLMLTGFISVVPPTIGDELVFPAFAAAVIGGVSLFGGRGKVTGALGGVLLLGVIQAALNISGTPPEQVTLVNGLVLLGAILVYSSRRRLRERILSQQVEPRDYGR